nr:leucine-rich repeat domain-containing protein [Lachnospiraceae bacterium]
DPDPKPSPAPNPEPQPQPNPRENQTIGGEGTYVMDAFEKLKAGDTFTEDQYQYRILSIDETKEGRLNVSVCLVKDLDKKRKNAVASTVKYTQEKTTAHITVTEIGAKAFANHKKLTRVTIGKDVTKIGKQAFSGCGKLKKIKVEAENLQSVGKNALKGIHKKCVIKVPKSKKKAYTKKFKKKGQKKTVKVK